jgi:glycosyltransferase involved in cell wall biosynthesis
LAEHLTERIALRPSSHRSRTHRRVSTTNENGGRKWRIAHSEFSQGWGGQEMRDFAELTGFRDRGAEVTLIAPSCSQIFKRCHTEGISCVDLPTKKLGLITSVFAIARQLRERRIEILNTHSSRDGWFVALAGRVAKVPFIIRSRHIEVTYPNRWISRHAFTTLADYILCTSDRIREHLKLEFNLRDEVIETLPTGIDPDRFQAAGPKHEALEKLRTQDRRLVGMVSVLRSWKGHDVFIDAAKQLIAAGINADFVIAGAGPCEKVIKEWVADSGHADRFHLLGHTDEVPAVLRSLDVLAIPSLSHEGIPQIGLQALACETAVVGSCIGGIPEIIRDGETGRIVGVDNAEELAAGLRSALEDVSKTKSMSQAGRSMIEASHSRTHMLDRLEEIYAKHLPESKV